MNELPPFLVHSVLFSGGRLDPRVFEKRYVDRVSVCLKSASPFGICLIKRGSEVGAPPNGAT